MDRDSRDYFLVTISQDGEIYVEQLDRETLLKRFNDPFDRELDPACALAEVQVDDPNYWPDNAYLLVKGKVVLPEVISRVTEVEIE